MLTRTVQILRQREVQTDNDGLWWINPPGLGYFLLRTPNGVIILNRPRYHDSKHVKALHLNWVYYKFYLHPKAWHLCLSQHPHHQLTCTPYSKRRGREHLVYKSCRDPFLLGSRKKKRCSDLIETAESEYKVLTASMSVSSWGWWYRSVAQLSCWDKH